MKFYKVHAAKFKNNRVFVMPDQFTEIGPDAFLQTNFEIIIISDNVTIIRDHAFEQISDCSIFVPTSVTEIEPLAFEGMGSYNIIFCEKNSIAHKACIERELNFDNDVGAIRKKAVEIKEIEENKKRKAKEQEKQIQEAEQIKREAQAEAERIKREAQEEARQIRQQALNSVKESDLFQKSDELKYKEFGRPIKQEQKKPIQDKVKKDETKQVPDEELFFEKFGLPPIVGMYSQMGKEWKKQISLMETDEIVENYDSDEYCEEYRYYCYEELKSRYNNNTLKLKHTSKEVTVSDESSKNIQVTNEESFEEQNMENDITYLLGMPPKYNKTFGFNSAWERDIHELSTREILDRYDSDEWSDEYRYLCYKELSIREDLETIICNE